MHIPQGFIVFLAVWFLLSMLGAAAFSRFIRRRRIMRFRPLGGEGRAQTHGEVWFRLRKYEEKQP